MKNKIIYPIITLAVILGSFNFGKKLSQFEVAIENLTNKAYISHVGLEKNLQLIKDINDLYFSENNDINIMIYNTNFNISISKKFFDKYCPNGSSEKEISIFNCIKVYNELTFTINLDNINTNSLKDLTNKLYSNFPTNKKPKIA